MNSPATNESTVDVASNDHPVLQCKNICKTFSEGALEVQVLNGISLSVHRNERIAIMGSSGSGKSTLLHILGGLDTCTSGEVIVDGQDLLSLNENQRGDIRNEKLGFVYQFHHLLPEFTALENVMMPLVIRGVSILEAKELSANLLTRVGLESRISHKPGELSGGERQRTAIARALITKPKCILADEPTGNLDHTTALSVYDLLLELNIEMGTSIIMVTHDSELASRFEKVLEIEDGVIKHS